MIVSTNHIAQGEPKPMIELQTPIRPSKVRRHRADPGWTIRGGVVIQPRFPRELHKRIKAAAAAQDLTLSRWIIEVCQRELERRNRRD